MSPSTITRLKRGWEAEYAAWRQRDWHGHEFVYLWADGNYVNVRAEERRCVLVVVGCDVHGRKHFLAIEDGFRESTFATIRLRTRKTRNCVSAKSGLSLMHKLAMSAQKRWRRLRASRSSPTSLPASSLSTASMRERSAGENPLESFAPYTRIESSSPKIEAKFKLAEVFDHVLSRDRTMRSLDRALEVRPEAFNRIRTVNSVYPLLRLMVDRAMVILRAQEAVDARLVRAERRAFYDVLRNVRLQFLPCRSIDYVRLNLAGSFDHSENDSS